MAEARVERRLAAILAADVAGYSRLMGVDEEGTLAALKALRTSLIDPRIAEYRGRLVKTTGDGILVEFASTVDAVRCAIDIQRAIPPRDAGRPPDKKIEFRIGINVGDIIVDGDDIFGDGVNVAARLESISQPGGICISDVVHQQVNGRVEVAFADLGEHNLKNIARPVHVYRIEIGNQSSAEPNAPPLPLPDKPSIAVLPFRVMQGTDDDEAFADGLTDDIITALSRIRALFVIARNSSFTYKDKAVDIRQVGRELGVRYLMEGSIRRSADRLRVTAQLVEAEFGNHIWAEKYDRSIADIFDVQDDITRIVAASTQTQVALEEGARAERAERPETNVWLLIKRSWRLTHYLTPEALAEARSFAERALQLAPKSGLAHEVLGVVLVHQVFMHTVADAGATLAKAREAAVQAARLEGSSEYAYWALGMVQFTSGEPDQAILSLRQGLEVNPNCALVNATIGNYLAMMGHADESIVATELSIRINPRDPSIFFRYQALADAYFVKRDFNKMVEWAAKAVVLKPSYFGCHLRVIAGLALLGRLEEARVAVERYLRDVPDEIRSRVRRFGFVRKEDSALFVEGLRKAGLPSASPG